MKKLLAVALFAAAGCAPRAVAPSPSPAATPTAKPAIAVATAPAGDAVVKFRDRAIDLTPFIEGFPYKTFTPDYETGLFFYMHEKKDSMQMLVQPLPASGEIDLAKGTPAFADDIDWAKRSFWGFEHHPASKTMVLWGDEKNDEVVNLYEYSLEKKTLRRVTDKPYVYGFDFDEKKEQLVFLPRYNAKEPYRTCLTRLSWPDGKEEELFCDEGAEYRFTWTSVLWRQDSSGVVLKVNKDGDRAKGNLALYDFKTKKLTALLDPKKGRHRLSTMDEWIDPTRFLYVSDETGFTNVFLYDLKTKRSTQVTAFEEELGAWEPLVVGGKVYAAVIVKRPYETELMVYDPLTRERVFAQRQDDNIAIQEHRDNRLYVYRNSVKTFLEIQEWTFRSAQPPLPGNGTVAGNRLTLDMQARVKPPAALAEQLERCNVERVSYPTFDVDPKTKKTRMLHAYLFTPKDAPKDPAQRFALITSFYGGDNVFNRDAGVVCAAGGMAFSPAVRGSSGFGLDFWSLNDKDLGGNEIVDVVMAGKYLKERFGLSEKQVGVWGGSHGGYATMRLLTFPTGVNGRTETFDFGFGISHAGFSNILTFYEKCNIPDWVKLEAGDPVKEKDKLLDRSPISHVEKLRSPILLTHGENDMRVPVVESRQFAEKAKALGRPVTYVEFEGQGHGLKGIPNQKRLWQTRFSFLEDALDERAGGERGEGATRGGTPSGAIDAPAAGSGGGAPGK